MEKSVFLMSNGSKEYYNNTLTNFANKLPTVIENNDNEKYEIAVESIGLSCLFRNIKIPDEKEYPSFILSNCPKSTDFDRGNLCIQGEPSIDPICEIPLTYKFQSNEDGSECRWVSGRFLEKYYSDIEIQEYFTYFNKTYNLKITYENNVLTFGRGENRPPYWVLIHPTMMETFGFESAVYLKYRYNTKFNFESVFSPGDTIYKVIEEDDMTMAILWKKKLAHRLVNYFGHIYFAYLVNSENTFPKSTKTDITKRNYPTVVKIVSNNVEPQIFNNSFSNDLVVFCPDFKKHEDYHFHEFESKQYIPMLNTTITDFTVKLTDEYNQQLQLLPGIPTIIKLVIKSMEEKKKSFNIRLTSVKTEQFQKNTNYNFKVKLPNILSLDKTWRVSLTSISHPNDYRTFLPDTNDRTMLFRKYDGNVTSTHFHTFAEDLYTIDRLLNELRTFLEVFGGELILISPNKVRLKFSKPGTFWVSNNVLQVLGYNEWINLEDNATKIEIHARSQILKVQTKDGETKDSESEDDLIVTKEEYILDFHNPINLEFLKPNYVFVYANFVESSIIGGKYSKILRVFPLQNKDKGFVITEFKHNEYLELQNTDISEMEIEIRSHDGQYINFATNEDIILNLEFTNHWKN